MEQQMCSDGLVNVLKPPGMSSHDVVAFIRRVYQTKKVGQLVAYYLLQLEKQLD